jgi:serine/threonine-protein kinase
VNALSEGTSLEGRYRIEGRLGQGGMGAVYRATRLQDALPVAIKIVTPDDFGEDAEVIRRRFDVEVRATASVVHPNTVTVFEHGSASDGRLFLAMELLNGWRLSDLLDPDSPMPPGRVVDVARQIADALAAIHARQLVHRDLKAENVLIVPRPDRHDHVKLIDFGLARDLRGALRLTGLEHRVGTPASMAPEYIAPEAQLDTRADLYALGVLMFHMLTGRRPYEGTPEKIMDAHLNKPAPRPSQRVPSVPRWLDDIVYRLLQKDPDDRYQSARDVRSALDAGSGYLRLFGTMVAVGVLAGVALSGAALAWVQP